MTLKTNKRYVLLLEVVIALMLVALCAVPLLAPQAYILYRQQRFLNEVNLDHLVNLLYADVILQLYRNDISWTDINSKQQFAIGPDEMIARTGFNKYLPFNGTYEFIEKKRKPRKDSQFAVYLFALNFTFSQEKRSLKYEYKVFIVRNLETGEAEIIESDAIEPEEEEEVQEGSTT